VSLCDPSGHSYAGRPKGLPFRARGATEGRSDGQDRGFGAKAAEYGREGAELPIMGPPRHQIGDQGEMVVGFVKVRPIALDRRGWAHVVAAAGGTRTTLEPVITRSGVGASDLTPSHHFR
jgi:hypothetical protein